MNINIIYLEEKLKEFQTLMNIYLGLFGSKETFYPLQVVEQDLLYMGEGVNQCWELGQGILGLQYMATTLDQAHLS